MKASKKKIIVLVSMVALLVATGCLNYFLNVGKNTTPGNADGGSTVTPTFFETYRTDRLATREQEKVYLDEIITSATSDEEIIANAKAQKLALSNAMETELVLEGLIKAQGFEDAVVTISTENVNVVVKDVDLTLQEATKIMTIIVDETDFEATDIIIFPYV